MLTTLSSIFVNKAGDMARQKTPRFDGIGKLTCRPEPGDGLIARTLTFVRENLPKWRDDPSRPNESSENSLNSALCSFLDHQSRLDPGFPMARFMHQALQPGNRSVDIGVHSMEELTSIEAFVFSKYDPFLLIEGKRLPSDRSSREREYVTGVSANGNATGGIQRFKLGVHGHRVTNAAIVGYIQDESPRYWHRVINEWIESLASEKPADDCQWSGGDQLQILDENDVDRTSVCVSSHDRIDACVTPSITIHHFWVCMARHTQEV